MDIREIQSRADAWIKPLMLQRPGLFHQQVQARMAEIANLNSRSATLVYSQAVLDMNSELELRGRIVYQGYKTALEKCGEAPPPGLEEDLRVAVKACLIDQANLIWSATDCVRRACGMTHARQSPDFRWSVVNKTSAQLKCLCAELRKHKLAGPYFTTQE
jgi:hypothetical protein